MLHHQFPPFDAGRKHLVQSKIAPAQSPFQSPLDRRSRSAAPFATKVGYFEDPADFRRPAAIKRQIEDNPRRLRRDRVDLLQVHEANWSAWWQGGGGRERLSPEQRCDFAGAPVFDALRAAKAEGRCRFIGITGNVASEMTRALRNVAVDALLIAFNYDLVLRTAEAELLPLARENQVALFAALLLCVTHETRAEDWEAAFDRADRIRYYAVPGASIEMSAAAAGWPGVTAITCQLERALP
jgi:aryl-alcohol dehydrogenase-like predicted oxidoreductase